MPNVKLENDFKWLHWYTNKFTIEHSKNEILHISKAQLNLESLTNMHSGKIPNN